MVAVKRHFKTIAGLVPYSGSVLIDGQEVHGQKRKELATK